MLSCFVAISSRLWKRFPTAYVLNYASSEDVCVLNSNPLDGLLGQWCGMSETWGFNPKTYAASPSLVLSTCLSLFSF